MTGHIIETCFAKPSEIVLNACRTILIKVMLLDVLGVLWDEFLQSAEPKILVSLVPLRRCPANDVADHQQATSTEGIA